MDARPRGGSTPPRRPRAATRAYDAAIAGVARVVRSACRVTRMGGGTSLPGLVVQRLDPGLVSRRSRLLKSGIAVVTGTNGKTTTSAMLSAILSGRGHGVVTNASGANMFRGIAGSFLRVPRGASFGVFEVDEGAVGRLVPAIEPRVLVLTNVFRDQLDRFGEPETVAGLLRDGARGVPPGATVVVNADDPLLSHSVEGLRPIGFGVRGSGIGSASRLEGEPELCPRCGGPVSYLGRTIAHLGRARCDRCSWRSRDPDVLVEIAGRPRLAAMPLQVGRERLLLHVGGIHNAYNVGAAIAAARAFGVSTRDAIDALSRFHAAFGRTEELTFHGRRLWILLAKNPAGTSATIAQVLAEPGVRTVVVMVSDRAADGKDVSWIWDADFESLAAAGLDVVAGGTRAAEVAIRMKYAGGRVMACEEDTAAALSRAAEAAPPGAAVCVLATYTSMLEARRAVLESRVARVGGVAA